MEIRLPKKFEEKMGEDLCAECKVVYKKYGKFANSEMYFFPEYTDHSFKHIQYVLETANNIIPNDTFERLNSNDIFVLCLSILFHDLGMHITFKSLKSMYELNPKDDLLGKSFVDLWKEYIEKNKISNELIELREIDEDIIKQYIDCCAEFIREYHPMIANIIATQGFPIFDNDNNANVERYNEKSNEYFYKLSGIVARSHGENLRVMLSYLQEQYGMIWKTPYDCHVVYLMCVVRIADYLHITDDRINPYRLNLLEFYSNKSKTEYLKHKSVEYSQRIYGNPEAIYIEANPNDCKIFIELVELLKCIQWELDSSWAVLGEVYEVSEFKLSIRRVTSNILENKWQQRSDYVPERLKFHFDIRLVDLLIEPLYGNSASYGIRELIQNATDACKTRQALYCEEDYNPEVKIIIEKREKEGQESRYLKIVDNGIGMSLDVIKNHFLNIGSKFRDSNEWNDLKEYKNEQDEPAEKNGKFGVGILSSYLLGDVLNVKTCNVAEKVEYDFQTERDTQLIEINKNDQGDFYGTIIEIKLKDDINVKNLVIGQWYISDDISLNINIMNETMERRNLIKLGKNENGSTWKKLDLNNSNLKVYWSYEYKIPVMNLQGRNDNSIVKYNPNLVCNGIVIPKKYDEKNKNSIVKLWPTVYVIDRKGELELNLSRDEVNGNLPFIEELETVLLQNFIQKYREIGKQNDLFTSIQMVSSQFNIDNYYNQKIMFGKNGYVLFNLFFLKRLEKELYSKKVRCEVNDFYKMSNSMQSKAEIKIVRIWTNRNINIKPEQMLDDNVFYIFEGIGYHPALKPKITNYIKDVPFSKAYIYMSKQQLEEYKGYSANIYRLSQKFIDENMILCFEDSNWIKEELKLNLEKDDIALAIEYSSYQMNQDNDGSEIFEKYYEEGVRVLQTYS